MSSTWFTAFRPYGIMIGCSPVSWTPDDPERALLSRTGSESTPLRQLLSRSTAVPADPGEPPRVLISLFDARSVLGQVVGHDNEPSTDEDRIEWDIIEQAPVEFGRVPRIVGATRGSIDSDLRVDEILPDVAAGWHMVRVLCMGLHPDSYLTQIRIDIWPVDTPSGHEVIKRRPATFAPPEARAGRERDVATLWPRLREALHDAGARHTVLGPVPDTQTSPSVEELILAGLEPDPPRAVQGLNTDLTAWFTIMQTLPYADRAGLIPGYDVLQVDEALSTRATMVEAWDIGEVDSYPGTAGKPAYTFIPEYFPIADLDGYLLVADMRPGPLSGLIRAFEKVDADDDTATWLSIGDLLLDLIVAIETGTPFDGWMPAVVGERLEWTLRT